MCIGSSPVAAAVIPQRDSAAFQDAPPVVTGKQTGVENPKDTKKVTEELKIKRQKKEGTYVKPNPNLQRTTQLLTKSSGGRGGVVARNQRSARLRGKAQSNANNRNKTSTKTNTSTSRSRHSSQSRTRRGGRR